MAYAVDNSDQYPTLLSDAGVNQTGNVSYQYSQDNTVSPHVFCVTAAIGAISYYSSSSNGTPKVGVCPGQNLVVWDKAGGGVAPVPGATIDTSVFRTSIESMRIGPAKTGQGILGSPFSGTTGQTYTVSFWIKTDSTWDGTSTNSKVRFGDGSSGALLTACGYGGVTVTWTVVTCSYKLTASVTSVSITVGNDGTTGNIWIDDLTVVLTGP